MSFADVMELLPGLSFEQRQALIRRALEIDEPPLSPAEMALIDERLSGLRQNPETAVTLEDMAKNLRSRFSR